MNKDNHSAESNNHSPLRRIQLAYSGDEIVVVPSPDAEDRTPFRFPLIPRTMTDFVATVCEYVWQRHRRCCGALLLLDLSTRQWTFGIPNQRAGRLAASWGISAEDLGGLPTSTGIAGSFQCRVLEPDESALLAVPPFAGVHLVEVIKGEDREITCFVSTTEHVRQVPASEVVFDELGAAIQECDRRISLT